MRFDVEHGPRTRRPPDRRPRSVGWTVGRLTCTSCARQWTAIRPERTLTAQCPGCGQPASALEQLDT